MANKTKTTSTTTKPLYPTNVVFTSLVINVANPKATLPVRPGTKRARRWAILLKQNGNTIANYYSALRVLGLACSKNNPVLAASKGLITLTAPSATK